MPASASGSPPHPVASFLAELVRAPRQAHGLLTLWPLVGPAQGSARRYRRLADAVAGGVISVHEIEEGDVPCVRVENRDRVAVLVLLGETIRGARQSRIAHGTFLVPPQTRSSRWIPTRGPPAREALSLPRASSKPC